MRITGKLFLVVILGIGISSCFDPPSFSRIPVISNPSLYFVEVPIDSPWYGNDSLVMKFHFTDGDGDVGLDNGDGTSDKSGKFTANWYLRHDGSLFDPEGKIMYSQYFQYFPPGGGPLKLDSIVTYDEKLTLGGGYDTLPDLNCTQWSVLRDVDNNITATVYQINNRFYSNVWVDLLIQDPATGNFSKYDFAKAQCNVRGLDGRVPILFTNPNKDQPLEGNIRYWINTSGWLTNFGRDVLKLRITLLDRALNQSNTLETGQFTIDGIRK